MRDRAWRENHILSGIVANLSAESFRVHGVRTVLAQVFQFVIQPGECLCLSGPSGSGKTLLLRALADLDPYQGEIWLGDTECQQCAAPLWRQWVGMLPAESHWWQTEVGQHFADPDAAVPTIQALGLSAESIHWSVSRLSTGERQKLAIVRLLANQPKVLLLDEPTANLDPESTRQVEELIRHYQAEKLSPILWVSHSQEQIRRVSNRLLRLTDAGMEEIACG